MRGKGLSWIGQMVTVPCMHAYACKRLQLEEKMHASIRVICVRKQGSSVTGYDCCFVVRRRVNQHAKVKVALIMLLVGICVETSARIWNGATEI